MDKHQIIVRNLLDFAVVVTRLKKKLEPYTIELLHCEQHAVSRYYHCQLAINGHECGFAIPESTAIDVNVLAMKLLLLYAENVIE